MNDLKREEDQILFDASPYLRLYIDKDGRWFQNGLEIIHKEIYLQFNQVLEKTADGGYRVRMGKEICRVEVEDAPFVVRRIIENEKGQVMLELNDETKEIFNPYKFWIGKNNIPYSHVKEGAFHARFSRPAYYQSRPFYRFGR